MPVSELPEVFRHFPGIVLHLNASGTIQASNGRLESHCGSEVTGHPLVEFLDPSSSAEKLGRLLSEVVTIEPTDGRTWEFVLRGADTLQEPHAFSALWEQQRDRIWLVEHPRDPRFANLRSQVIDTNTELSNTQRELFKERSELAAALTELEEQQRVTEGLMETVREQNVELQRSNRALDDFAHAISHDLKAPLRNIGRYANILREDLGEGLDEESVLHLNRLEQLVERLRAMIDGVLDFSRVGRRREEAEPVDVGKMVERIADLLEAGENVTIEHVFLPTFVTEAAPLQQVLLNLISNGARYAEGPSPAVRVDARREGDSFHFRVSDTGPGVPASMRDRIWNLFQTLEPSSPDQGTGIGLAIVKRQVEEMGGSVWVDSEAGGATFHFTWPGDSAGRSGQTSNDAGNNIERQSGKPG